MWFELLVLVRDVNRAPRHEIARQHARHPVFELHAAAGTDAHDLIDFLRIEASLLAEHQRLGNSDSGDLAEHVVDQLHRQSMPEPADMEHILAHRAEQVLAGRKGLGYPADDYPPVRTRRAG